MDTTKTALVTGANKGIGFQIAAGLAARGYQVAVGVRNDERRKAAVAELQRAGADVFGVHLDVSSDEGVAAAMAMLGERRAPGRSSQQCRHLGTDRRRRSGPRNTRL